MIFVAAGTQDGRELTGLLLDAGYKVTASVVSHYGEQLLEQVWGFDFFGDSRTVDVHVKRIREKLGDDHEWELRTVWGVGYKFEQK